MYRIDIMTLFPDTVGDVLSESILGRAQERDILRIETHQIRDYTLNKQKQVDDYPYGGGRGAVMQADPLFQCWDHICKQHGTRPHTIYLSPCGKTFTQADAKRLSSEYDHLILVCGHYEGIDQRFIDAYVDEEISLGDFVLTGGEIAAMAVSDAVCRLIPGVLADPECFQDESHWDGLLEYPQYSRPEVWHGLKVPGELLSGNHATVSRWRRKAQLRRTMTCRPDMFSRFTPTNKLDTALLKEIERDLTRRTLPENIELRLATESDLPEMASIARDASKVLARHKVDQWQGGYPGEEDFLADISGGECHVVLCDGEISAFFTLTLQEQENYNSITDGKWSGASPYSVLHRCAVSLPWRGSGLADKMIEFAESLTLQAGRQWLRVDTHKKNKPMQALLIRNHYQYRGNVLVSVAEGHDPKRLAYEKRLKGGTQ